MKSILMSIQPKWCEKIVNGEKTIEVRKTAPKEVPFKVYIYCTTSEFKNRYLYLYPINKRKDFGVANWWRTQKNQLVLNEGTPYEFVCDLINGKVIGEFICNRIETIPVDSEAFIAISKPACITMDELIDYCSGNDMYGLHISDLKVYDKPKELGEFHRFCGNDGEGCPDADCPYYEEPSYEYGEITYDCYSMRPIARPPRSWQYVEE